ncbi:Os01g0567800 [Oryza sativa Japonica Group]|jgi:hypothetical protein|uniref:Os01g0567800 protein n=1 Tax=Oryza sativa subsp. japonica TaxID=39947 RepID=A0A0P0V484_ORYSJ|nr:Os01g0567800 [Oryza sativa Japonica Group]
MVQLDADDANSGSAASATHSHAIGDMPQPDASSRTSADEDDHGHNVGIDDIDDAGDNGSIGSDSDVPSCAVCTEPLEWAAVGPCGHRAVCSACAARVRSAPNPDNRCCICRTICPFVVVTKAAAGVVSFSTLPAVASHDDGRVGEYWYCAAVSAYFDDEQQYEAAKAVASRRHGDQPAMVHRAVHGVGTSRSSSRPALCLRYMALPWVPFFGVRLGRPSSRDPRFPW